MKVAVFSSKRYDQVFLEAANHEHRHELLFISEPLTAQTAVLAGNADAVCVFVNDKVDAETLDKLAWQGCRLIALRCAGFNNVDLKQAAELQLRVVRVPAYSPYAVAEHALALILTLNRKTHRAYNRVREGNFALEGLLGFDIHGSTIGVVGTGKIGTIFAQIMRGLGCEILAYDIFQNPACLTLGVGYVGLDELFAKSDIISLHCPLTPESRHIINQTSLARMKRGVMVINTSRGALVDTEAVIAGLKTGQIGYLGLDVYEQESDLFFENLSDTIIQDDVFQRLMTFPNVVVTGHQAYFTATALRNISDTTIGNLDAFVAGQPLVNEVTAERIK